VDDEFADDGPFDPAASLRLIEQQRAEAMRRISPDPRLSYWPWGFAWLIGFALFFLDQGPDGRALVDLPQWLPLTVLLVLLVVAGLASATAGTRAYGHITGDSSRRGAYYGWAWTLGFAGLVATFIRVSDFLPDPQKTLMWAAGTVALTGALHMAGGAVWLDRTLFRVGLWISVINVLGVVAGPGWHALIVCVAGGGAMIVGGAVAWARWRRR
jgi:hypothetical protein